MGWIIKKKTREEQIELRTSNVFTELMSDVEIEFTELETIQILNNVRRKLSEHLDNKKAGLMEQSVVSSQRAKEIGNALEYME